MAVQSLTRGLHTAKHYVEMMGSVEAAQRYLDRVKRLVELFR